MRSGAKPGDAIFVTGKLGGAAGGLKLLERGFEIMEDLHDLTANLVLQQLKPTPQLIIANSLQQLGIATSMIDLSDGLAGDLRHILQASDAGAELLASAIPISRAARQSARKSVSAKTPLVAALSDGEDFELLFTLPGRDAVQLLDAWKKKFPELRLSCIGKIITEKEISIRDKHGRRPLTIHGYEHFAQPGGN